MITFYSNNKGYAPLSEWAPNCWVNVLCPTEHDRNYLLYDLNVPESFLNDIDDMDERPRIEEEDGWYLIILRAPYKPADNTLMYATIPLGIIVYGDICISVCNHQNEIIPDFITYSIRKQVIVNNPYDLVMRLLLSSSVWYLKYLKQINIQITQVERLRKALSTSEETNKAIADSNKQLLERMQAIEQQLKDEKEQSANKLAEQQKQFDDRIKALEDSNQKLKEQNDIIIKENTIFKEVGKGKLRAQTYFKIYYYIYYYQMVE